MYPIAFELFGLQITTYGILVAMAFAFVWWRISLEGPRKGISSEFLQNLLLVVLVSSLVGARCLHILTHFDWFRQHPFDAVFSRSGYDFVGGFVAAAVATAIWSVWCKESPAEVGDLIAPYLAYAHAIGRVGCFLFGCCYGTECHQPWAVHFPPESDAYAHHGDIGTHPVQLYEMLALVCIGSFLLWLRARRRFPWQIFSVYVLLYGIARFGLEFFRGDDRGALGAAWLSPSQILYGLLVIVASALFAWLWKSACQTVRTET